MSRRVMLKLSGEALAGERKTGIDDQKVLEVAEAVKKAYDQGVEIAIVIGGGNFWRGRQNTQFDRVKSDQIGMLATVINCLCVSELFRTAGMDTAVYCSFEIPGIVDVFNKDKVMEDLTKHHKVVFFAGGTGHPYFSTDTGIALRAVEIGADCILLAKSIDGVYDSDPAKNPEAKKYDQISLGEVLNKKLGVIDLAASVICMENKMPLMVFAMDPQKITQAMDGTLKDGTRVTTE